MMNLPRILTITFLSGFLFWDLPSATGQSNDPAANDVNQDELDPEYLKKWTPIRRMDSRFPYENETDEDWMDDRFQKMDTGPTFCSSVRTPGMKANRGMTPKALAIRLGRDPQHPAAILFDTERLYVRVAWTGEFLELPPKRFGMLQLPSVKGEVEFTSDWDVSWSWQDENERTVLVNESNCRFENYTFLEDCIQLDYRVNGVAISEINRAHASPSADSDNVHKAVFQRTLLVENNKTELTLSLVSQIADSFHWLPGAENVTGVITSGETSWLVHVDANSQAQLRHESLSKKRHRISLVIPKANESQTIGLQIVQSKTGSSKDLAASLAEPQPTEFNPGQKLRWGQPLVTRGKRAADDQPLVVDEITVPYENPFNALMYTSGLDFLPDGTALVCTMHGDVWRVMGIDDDLDEIQWQRFATGLYQPLGLKVIEGTIYVLGRDRITILNDMNGDGEADQYVNFCDLLDVQGQPHAYAMSLETDSQGYFYFIKSGGSQPHGGTMLQVSPDGKSIHVFASGYRHANGLGVGPNDEITSADNEGNWIPTTRIDMVRQGGFYGHMPTHRRETEPESYDQPLCWVPRLIDSSAGGQVWVNSKRWGPLDGKMLHLSFGRATANVVLHETVAGVHQAGIYKLDLPTFLSGIMRGRFNPRDGHLYVTGLDGWQTAAVKDGCLQRVRATGKPIYLPTELHVRESGIEITFSQPVDIADATKMSHWDVQQWGYRWSKEYGSDHFRVSNPEEVGHDEVEIIDITVSPDARTVILKLAHLKPVMQMQITGKIRAADGTLMPVQIFNTIHNLGP